MRTLSPRRRRPLIAAAILACLSSLASPAETTARDRELGTISFPNSGSAAAQDAFLRGVLLLHSFEYMDAADAFREAQAIDPGFALAYWGEAMTHHHPIWQEEDLAAARAVLQRLAPTAAERRARAGSEREQGLLDSLETLLGPGPRPERRRAYGDALAALQARFPDDLEVASFHALSLLGLSFGVRDVPSYMRAAAIAEEVQARNPRHPGALHYLIHAYDDPVHAPLGLRFARLYGQVAPAAAHALHMPAHIYFALGMWEDSAAANEASIAAAEARRVRKGLGVKAKGLHSIAWLAYTYLQQGKFDRARTLLTQMQADAEASGELSVRFHLAVMKAAHAVATGEATAGRPLAIKVRTDDLALYVSAGDHLVEGLAAARAGDLLAARALLQTMRDESSRVSAADAEAVHAGCAPIVSRYSATDPPGRQAALVMAEELAGFIQLREGKPEESVRTLRQATVLEDAMDFDFGPPQVVKPAHELLGEVLLELDRPAEAETAFAAALARAPGRTLAIQGRSRAAALEGRPQVADADDPILRETRRGRP